MNGQNIFLIGISHKDTHFSLLEKVAVPKAGLQEALRELKILAELEEIVIISTCSRVEVAAVARHPEEALDRLRGWFNGRGGGDLSLYAHQGEEVIRHLIRVSSGLDSWIIGESEILRQVKESYSQALDAGFSGRFLNKIFQRAIGSGKDIRAVTGLQNGIKSIGGAAALLAKKIFGEMTDGRVLVFGAGQAAEAVVRHLLTKNFKEILVANRTVENAQPLAASLGGKALSLDEGIEALAQADVAVFSASAQDYMLDPALLSRYTARRSRALFLIDLGMPRNVDPACGDCDGVFLYSLGELKNVVEENTAQKSSSVAEAEALSSRFADKLWDEMSRTFSMMDNRMDLGRAVQAANGEVAAVS